MFNMPATIQTLYNWTHVTLDANSKEQVKESIQNDIETGITEDWDLVEHTPFTEPFWGIVVNKLIFICSSILTDTLDCTSMTMFNLIEIILPITT